MGLFTVVFALSSFNNGSFCKMVIRWKKIYFFDLLWAKNNSDEFCSDFLFLMVLIRNRKNILPSGETVKTKRTNQTNSNEGNNRKKKRCSFMNVFVDLHSLTFGGLTVVRLSVKTNKFVNSKIQLQRIQRRFC